MAGSASSESRRSAAPGIAGTCFRAPILEQLHHVLAVELGRMRLLEVISDIGELEANAVPLRQRVDAIQIPNAAVGGERGHGSGGDRRRAARDLVPALRQTPVTDNVCGAGREPPPFGICLTCSAAG